ncbi:MAG: response regulator [Pyrinomonadaceae bacterium]|nr:response regulator [Pyrinomonadaceae bacterium]MCX7640736.1 response regulator [Pyrinomonadaceae bacterium]MDW8304631.1 response regulator [Acidobacteriota bacterium]
MRNILIVDDEKAFLQSLVEGLKNYQDKFTVLTASNGKEAIERLSKQKVDLLVTDIKMPVLDGFGLLAHVLNNFPDMPVIVMTAYGTPDLEREIKATVKGVVYLEKPIDFDLLVQTIQSELDQFAEGYLSGITLASFLQIVEIERKSGALFVSSASGKKGHIYFSKGKIINAKTMELDGEKAFYEIMSWEEVEIEVQKLPKDISVKIKSSLQNLLMEAMRIKDESSPEGSGLLHESLFSTFSKLNELKGFFTWNLADNRLIKSYVEEAKFEGLRSFLLETLEVFQNCERNCEDELEYILFCGERLCLIVFIIKGLACGMIIEKKGLGKVIYKMTDFRKLFTSD